jgi:hypothetical protein
MELARTYLSIDGVIQSEHRAGEANSRDYMLDPSGNVVAVYITDYIQANAAYSPFGSILDSWNMESYKFTFGGGYGYRQTNTVFVSAYVRARHYAYLDATWTTRDPLWPYEMQHGYVEGRVPGSVDLSEQSQTTTQTIPRPSWVPRSSHPSYPVPTERTDVDCHHGDKDEIETFFKFIKLDSVIGQY